MADEWKTKGNGHFSAKEFPEAIECFSKGIEIDPSNHVLFSNRSASYASLNQFDQAKADAEKCVSINPSWAKGYLRLGSALHGLKDFPAALESFDKGLEIESSNASLLDAKAACEKDMQQSQQSQSPFAKMFGPDCLAKIAANPKLQKYLGQPDYINMIQGVMKNPNMAQAYLQDQRFMETFMVLSGIDPDMLGKKEGAAPSESSASSSAAPAPKHTDPKPAATPASASASSSANMTNEQKALAIKEEGNKAYKKRDFDTAIAKYEEAFNLEPTNTTFLLNKTAVLFEQGKYDECLELCVKAREHGAEHKADYKLLVKLMTRQASCIQKQGNYEEALKLFGSALLEHRNAETLNKKDACEKEWKEVQRKAYLDPELAIKAKDEGNTFFKADNFPEAVKCYNEAVKRDPTLHTVYSNRAAALIKLGAYEDAVKDCDKCIELQPDFVRAYARKGNAYFFSKQYNQALKAYEAGKKLDANNAECLDGYQRTMMKIQEVAQGEGNEDVAQRAMADPEIAGIMQDSYMQMVLGEMQKNPARIQEYMQDPGIAGKINKLIAAGILRVGNQGGGGAGRGAAGGRR